MESGEEEEFWNQKGNKRTVAEVEIKREKERFFFSSDEDDINNNEQERKQEQNRKIVNGKETNKVENWGNLEMFEEKNIVEKTEAERSSETEKLDKLFQNLEKLKPRKSDMTMESQASHIFENRDNSYPDSGEELDRFKDEQSFSENLDDKKQEKSMPDDVDAWFKDDIPEVDTVFNHEKSTEDTTSAKRAQFRETKNIKRLPSSSSEETNEVEKFSGEGVHSTKEVSDVMPFASKEVKLKAADGALSSDEDFEGKRDETYNITSPESPFRPRHHSQRRTRKAHERKKSSKEFQNDHDGKTKRRGDGDRAAGTTSEEEEFSSNKLNGPPRRRTRSRRRKRDAVDHTLEDVDREEAISSRSPRMRKELRSGDFDWSLSKSEVIQDWVKSKNQATRKQRAEERQKDTRKTVKQEKSIDSPKSSELKKKTGFKPRSRSCPGKEMESKGGKRPRSLSQSRIPTEMRSGDYDWTKSKNDEIQTWLKRKNRLHRKQRAEEKKKERLKRKEEEEKRKQKEELFAGSFERVSEWMKEKQKMERLMRKKQKEEEATREQTMQGLALQRKQKFAQILAEKQKLELKKHEQGSVSNIMPMQEHLLIIKKQEMPLLKQRERQQRTVLRNSSNQNPRFNATPKLNLGPDNSDFTSKQTPRNAADTPQELTLDRSNTIDNLPDVMRSDSTATSARRTGSHLLLRQSLSLSRITIPSEVEREQQTNPKKITFDDWLMRKKAEDEIKRQAQQKQRDVNRKETADAKELNKSVEVKQINLVLEGKKTKLDKVPHASGVEKRHVMGKATPVNQVKMEGKLAVSQTERDLLSRSSARSSSTARNEAHLPKEHSPVVTAGEKKVDVVADTLPNPYIVGGMDIPGTQLRAKSPKPKVAVRPTLRSVKYQRGSWDGFSDYLWDHVNELEGGELVASHDRVRLGPMGADAEDVETSSSWKGSPLERHDSSRAAAEAVLDSQETRPFGNVENQAVRDKSKEVDEDPPIWLNGEGRRGRMKKENYLVDRMFDGQDSQRAVLSEMEDYSTTTPRKDTGFTTSSARSDKIPTIIDADDDEAEKEFSTGKTEGTFTKEKVNVEREDSRKQGNLNRSGHAKVTFDTEELLSPTSYHNGSDTQDEIASDIEIVGSD